MHKRSKASSSWPWLRSTSVLCRSLQARIGSHRRCQEGFIVSGTFVADWLSTTATTTCEHVDCFSAVWPRTLRCQRRVVCPAWVVFSKDGSREADKWNGACPTHLPIRMNLFLARQRLSSGGADLADNNTSVTIAVRVNSVDFSFAHCVCRLMLAFYCV